MQDSDEIQSSPAVVEAVDDEPSSSDTDFLCAPWPYFGGKSAIADEVWQRLGDVQNYLEPFCGSCAMLLKRPAWHSPRLETVNDANAYLSNFWRAIKAEPEAVADLCNWPVNECDLEARHKWLVEATRKREHAERMRDDPDYYDVKIAAWWAWGLAQWIGRGWSDGEWHGRGHEETTGTGINVRDGKRPHLGDGGQGVHRQRPHLSSGPMGLHRKRAHLGDGHGGEEARRGDALRMWFRALRDRFRNVRVACGDWKRICNSDATTLLYSETCGVFLDPPYSHDVGRAECYGEQDDGQIAHEVREWCLRWGDVPGMRIALCGYDIEHGALEVAGWTVYAWSAHGGYANVQKNRGRGNVNRHRERVWFSPGCLRERLLF